MQDEHQDSRVKLENGAFSNDTEGNVLVSPALGNPVGHDRCDGEGSRNRCALEVLRLAALVLWQYRSRDVEPSQACQAAENKEGEENVVERRPHPERKCGSGRGEAERDLRASARMLALLVCPPLACPYQIRE